jgi:single-strand DNA-binding protein
MGSKDFCTVHIMGRLTRDPQIEYTSGGLAYCKFSIAVNEGSKKDGTELPASFFDVTAWDKKAETVTKFFHKGKQILIIGRLKQDRWQTQDGQNRSKVGIVLEQFFFIGKKGDDAGYSPTPPPQYDNSPGAFDAQAQPQSQPAGTVPTDDEVPF